MGKRPKRKIVLFLVEGKSDREALKLAIPELYDQIDEDIEVYFPVIRRKMRRKAEILQQAVTQISRGKTIGFIPII